MHFNRPVLENIITHAEKLVAEGEERLAAQRIRVAELKRRSGRAEQSTTLLKIMEETQSLQIDHVNMLKQVRG
jgi:hypothetical protein